MSQRRKWAFLAILLLTVVEGVLGIVLGDRLTLYFFAMMVGLCVICAARL